MSIQVEPVSLSEWFSTPLGARLLETELQYFDGELADVFGFNAIQLGLPEYPYLRVNRIAFRCVTGSDGPVGLRSDPCALPLQTASVDLVVLPHTLEFSSNPHQVLREVSRILMPEGHVVLSGFNPWSLWGARRLAARREGVFGSSYLPVSSRRSFFQTISPFNVVLVTRFVFVEQRYRNSSRPSLRMSMPCPPV